jgi:hypothetical protein
MKQSRPAKRDPQRRSAVLGIGLDAQDGHKRLTRGHDFLLAGGSEETHARMQETVIKVHEKLAGSGRRIGDASPAELRDLFHDAQQ